MRNFDMYQVEFLKQINALAGFESYKAFWDYEQDLDAQHRQTQKTGKSSRKTDFKA